MTASRQEAGSGRAERGGWLGGLAPTALFDFPLNVLQLNPRVLRVACDLFVEGRGQDLQFSPTLFVQPVHAGQRVTSATQLHGSRRWAAHSSAPCGARCPDTAPPRRWRRIIWPRRLDPEQLQAEQMRCTNRPCTHHSPAARGLASCGLSSRVHTYRLQCSCLSSGLASGLLWRRRRPSGGGARRADVCGASSRPAGQHCSHNCMKGSPSSSYSSVLSG